VLLSKTIGVLKEKRTQLDLRATPRFTSGEHCDLITAEMIDDQNGQFIVPMTTLCTQADRVVVHGDEGKNLAVKKLLKGHFKDATTAYDTVIIKVPFKIPDGGGVEIDFKKCNSNNKYTKVLYCLRSRSTKRSICCLLVTFTVF
jgi:hypothetical protein